MAYDDVVDLKPFSCVPLAVNFSPLGGNVFVQCANAKAKTLHFQLVMDLITSQVAAEGTEGKKRRETLVKALFGQCGSS